jgi:histidine triad (HIT) family protein
VNDCIFCKIVNGEVPSEKVLDTEHVVAFRDVNPVAPVHILVIPKKHIETMDEIGPEHKGLMEEMMLSVVRIARDEGFAEGGYRLVLNAGSAGGQFVPHLHMHVLAGRRLGWPPG